MFQGQVKTIKSCISCKFCVSEEQGAECAFDSGKHIYDEYFEIIDVMPCYRHQEAQNEIADSREEEPLYF